LKAILKFDLDDHEEVVKFNQHLKGPAMASALFEIMYNLRRKVSHNIEAQDLSPEDTLNYMMQSMKDILDDHNVDVQELINN